jgi:hypothetical protein
MINPPVAITPAAIIIEIGKQMFKYALLCGIVSRWKLPGKASCSRHKNASTAFGLSITAQGDKTLPPPDTVLTEILGGNCHAYACDDTKKPKAYALGFLHV